MKKVHVLRLPNGYAKDLHSSNYQHSRQCDQALSRDSKLQVGSISMKCIGSETALNPLKLISKKSFQKVGDGNVSLILNKYKTSFLHVPIPIRYQHPLLYSAYRQYEKEFGRPDILHGERILSGGYYAYMLSKWFDIPYIITEHSSIYMLKRFPGKYRAIAEKVIQKSNRACAVSDALRKSLEATFPFSKEKWIITPNVLNPIFENQCGDELLKSEIYKNKLKLVSVGTLDENKGQAKLIKAINNLADQGFYCSLDIIGDGQLRNKLEYQAASKNEFCDINFYGNLPPPKVAEILGKSDFLVVSSAIETFGIVLIEALALGKPVITTPCGGVGDIIEDSVNGIILKGFSECDIADGIMLGREILPKFDDTKIRARCIEKFGQKSFQIIHRKIYEEVLNELKKANYR